MLITKFRNYGNGIGFEVYNILKSKSYSFYIRKCEEFRDKRGVRIISYIFNLDEFYEEDSYFPYEELLKIEHLVGVITR